MIEFPTGGRDFLCVSWRRSYFCSRRSNRAMSMPRLAWRLAAFHGWVVQKAGPSPWRSWGNYDRRQSWGRTVPGTASRTPFERSPTLTSEMAFAADLKRSRGMGLGGALRKLGLRREGTAHRAIDDARSVVRTSQPGVAMAPWNERPGPFGALIEAAQGPAAACGPFLTQNELAEREDRGYAPGRGPDISAVGFLVCDQRPKRQAGRTRLVGPRV